MPRLPDLPPMENPPPPDPNPPRPLASMRYPANRGGPHDDGGLNESWSDDEKGTEQ